MKSSKSFVLLLCLCFAVFFLSSFALGVENSPEKRESDQAEESALRCRHGCCKWEGQGHHRHCIRCCRSAEMASLASENADQAEESALHCRHGCCKWRGHGHNRHCIRCCRSAEKATLASENDENYPNPVNEENHGGYGGQGEGGKK